MIYYGIALLVVIIDQWTKQLTVSNIELGETIPVIDNVLSLTYYRNTGAAGNILEGQMWFFYIVTIAVIVVIVYQLQKHGKESKLFSMGLAFILGGAIGNFIDRLLYQYVIDMIRLEFINFPIFNVADVSLNIGVILLFVYIIFFSEEEGKELS